MHKQLTPWNKYINKIKIMALPGFELPFFFFLSFFSYFSMLPGCTYLVFCSCFWRMILSKRKVTYSIKQLLFSSIEYIISWPLHKYHFQFFWRSYIHPQSVHRSCAWKATPKSSSWRDCARFYPCPPFLWKAMFNYIII